MQFSLKGLKHMNIWHHIEKDRIEPEEFYACIEISKGSRNKYELDKKTGLLKLDRVLYTSMIYPANYGFIPRTLAADNDPLDVMVLCQESIRPMTLVKCKPIGMVIMTDSDCDDEKIVCVPVGDPAYCNYNDISELPAHTFEKMIHFFEFYKTLEGKTVRIEGAPQGRDVAVATIRKYIDSYENYFGGRV